MTDWGDWKGRDALMDENTQLRQDRDRHKAYRERYADEKKTLRKINVQLERELELSRENAGAWRASLRLADGRLDIMDKVLCRKDDDICRLRAIAEHRRGRLWLYENAMKFAELCHKHKEGRP